MLDHKTREGGQSVLGVLSLAFAMEFKGCAHVFKPDSLRAFARDLKISVGFLSEVLHGKNDFSLAMAQKIFKALDYSESELEYISNLIISKTSKSRNERLEAKRYVNKFCSKLKYKKDKSKEKYAKSFKHFLSMVSWKTSKKLKF